MNQLAPPKAVRARDVKPMLAETRDAPFTRDGWLFELKLDGYRLIASKEKGAARLTSRNDAGAPVHQLLAVYQNEPEGGQGWLRLLTFSADGARVQVRTWSPVLERWRDNALNQFTLDLSQLAPLPPAPRRRTAPARRGPAPPPQPPSCAVRPSAPVRRYPADP